MSSRRFQVCEIFLFSFAYYCTGADKGGKNIAEICIRNNLYISQIVKYFTRSQQLAAHLRRQKSLALFYDFLTDSLELLYCRLDPSR